MFRQKIFAFVCLLVIAMPLSAGNRPFRVLSIDGGGVRGLIPAIVLKQVEEELGRPISDVFDMIAGTSTGGIIALSLATRNLLQSDIPNHSAAEMVDLYLNKRTDIFYAGFAHKLATMGGLLGPKYESAGLLSLLEERLGETRLSETIIPTLITGYYLEGEIGIEFFSEDARRYPGDKDCSLVEVGMATAASPMFFEPVDVSFLWGALESVADGGLYKQNPSLLAYLNAKKISQDRKIEVYSLGTGTFSSEELDAQFKGRGFLQWLYTITSHLRICGTEADDMVLHRLLNEEGEQNYFRLNVRIDAGHTSMDDISEENMQYLFEQGIDLIDTPRFAEMIWRLKK